MATKRTVAEVCSALVKHEELVASCNGYVQAVFAAFGLEAHVAGNADAIRGRFSTEAVTKAPWVYIGPNPAEATRQAAAGNLVVGGLTKAEMTYKGRDGREHVATMGHVVVVVPGGPSLPGEVTLTNDKTQKTRGGFPLCYGGAAIRLYRFDHATSVDAVFPAVLLDKVIYGYVPLPK